MSVLVSYRRFGSLFSADVDAIVNPVNVEGVMGAGLAAEFKRRLDASYFESYVAACRDGSLRIGTVRAWPVRDRYVIDLPTKRHWRERSSLAHVRSGLAAMFVEMERLSIASVGLPALGAGLGGLEWSDVRELFDETLPQAPNGSEFVVFMPREGRRVWKRK